MQTSPKYTKNNTQQAQASAIHNLKLPPYSLEAEQAVLGSIMIRPDAYAEIADIVTEENFYSEKHKKIYKGIGGVSSVKSRPSSLSF